MNKFLNDQYNVIGMDINPSRLNHANKIEIKTDLHRFSKDSFYRKKLLNEIKKHLPKKIEDFIVINNAAIQIINPIAKLKWDDWESSFAVNTIAPFFIVQGLKNELIKAHGHVINISSVHAKQTKKNFSIYAASKSALESLTRSLNLELSSKGVSINAISPAAISTKLLREGFSKSPQNLRSLIAIIQFSGRIGSPEELASFIKSISEQKGNFLTGSVIDFSGGITAKLHDPEY